MLCYRYLSRKWGLEALKTGKFKLCRVEETNDLFDCAGLYSGYFSDEAFKSRILPMLAPAGKREYRKVAKKGNKDLRRFVERGLTDELRLKMNYDVFHKRGPLNEFLCLLCMSEARDDALPGVALDDSLMWAHYAEKGCGIRIGLEIGEPDQHFTVRVKYADSIPCWDWSVMPEKWKPSEHDRTQFKFDNARVMTKSRAWSYEHEVRLVRAFEHSEIEMRDGLPFMTFPPSKIARVDFGARCFKNDYCFLKCVKKLRQIGYANTEFRLARMDPSTYGFKYVSEEYVRRSWLCAKCFHLRDATMNGIGAFARWWGNDVVMPAGASVTRTFEDVLGDMSQDDFEEWYDGFHDMTRKNAEPLAYVSMLGILNHLSLSPEDRFLLESEIFPIGE